MFPPDAKLAAVVRCCDQSAHTVGYPASSPPESEKTVWAKIAATAAPPPAKATIGSHGMRCIHRSLVSTHEACQVARGLTVRSDTASADPSASAGPMRTVAVLRPATSDSPYVAPVPTRSPLITPMVARSARVRCVLTSPART